MYACAVVDRDPPWVWVETPFRDGYVLSEAAMSYWERYQACGRLIEKWAGTKRVSQLQALAGRWKRAAGTQFLLDNYLRPEDEPLIEMLREAGGARIPTTRRQR